MKLIKPTLIVFALALTGCQSMPEAQNMATFHVAVSWDGTKSCFDENSPAFTVSGVPASADKLTFRMYDLNATYNHGGGEVAYKGQSSIPYGAFKYTGPCPPDGPHTYRWVIQAIDSKNQVVVGKATVERKFPG